MTGDMGGRWEFPGGKIEEGEDLQTAVVREMQEEFGVTVTVGSKITSGTFMHKDKPCTLDVIEVQFPHDGMAEPFILTEKGMSYRKIMDENLAEFDRIKPLYIKKCEREYDEILKEYTKMVKIIG